MRIASWNVNGLRAVARKGLLPWEQIAGVDLWCLQETKAQPQQLESALSAPAGWHAFWHSAEKPGYSSVAILGRTPPDEVQAGLGDARFDSEGRVLTLRYGTLAVVTAYFPNSQDGGRRLDYKLAFCAAMEAHLAAWRARGCETVLLGDYNIAHKPIDLARPHENEGTAGYLPGERAWMDRYLDLGYRDIFRERNPELAGAYSWWSMRTRARERNIGWRIDYATVSPGLATRVRGCAILPQIEGSDHCPVTIDL